MKRTAMVVMGIVALGAFKGAAASETDQETLAGKRRFRGATEVTASRLGDDPEIAGRREIVLTRVEIEELPVQSVQDLLRMVPGVGLARRGARGVQADINLRGGNSEQSVVLLNGVRINNPQTGHHNLDLFIPLAAIERVEILYGPSSTVHGPDAFGGAINIVTGVTGIDAFVRVGENDLTGGGVAAVTENGVWGAVEREVHTGFRDNTEADVNQAAVGYRWLGDQASVNLNASAGRRRFGAHAFYSTQFPDERERTSGQMFVLSGERALPATTLGWAFRFDRHNDDFILDRNRPEWYRNRHTTLGFLGNLNVQGKLAGWDWVAGIEIARDQIDSTNLGRHHRTGDGLFVEIGRFDGPLTYGVQARLDDQDSWGQVETYSLGGSWEVSPGRRLRLHHGTSFRSPSFTDLYYSSPSTVGNPDLQPEEGRSFEIGFETRRWDLTVFERRAEPLIDYVLDGDGLWRAANLGRLRTRGLEAGILLPVLGRLRWQRLSLVVLDSEIAVDPERSAYALAHPEIEAAWTGGLDLGQQWRASWSVSFRKPTSGGSWTTVDLGLGRRLSDNLWLNVEANNLLDRELTELHGIPLPGRWLSCTVRYSGGR